MNALTKSAEPAGDVADYAGGLLAVIERAARDPSVDIDKFERLIAIQERVQANAAKVAFHDALAALQPKLPVISERGKILNKQKETQSTYALWEDINEEIKPLLAEQGFSLSFRGAPASAPGLVAMIGILARSGHQEETFIELPRDDSGAKNAVQGIGSSKSYCKRYAAFDLLNITTKGQDDDGLSAGPAVVHQTPRDQPFPQGPATNKTALKTAGRTLWRDVESCGDGDQLDIILRDKDNIALMEQLQAALPSWWNGFAKDGDSHDGLRTVIERKQVEFGADPDAWKTNPLRAG